ncbi:MAG TPA: hypothetical protein VHX65_03355 [Pirellulales bacterium]|jgi:phosphatidylinositol glycan class B|nr:hypothetical protein [Pirellulales bacterium]
MSLRQNLQLNSGLHADPGWRRFVNRWSVVSFLLIAVVCHFSYDFYQFDEYYQVTEFVSYKLGKTPREALAWEYRAEMRPWLQPAMYYVAARGLEQLGIDNPFTLAEVFRALSGLCAWAAIVSLMLTANVFCPDDRRRRPMVIVLAGLFILPYLAGRTSSEAMSGNFFSLGFATLVLGSSLPALRLGSGMPAAGASISGAIRRIFRVPATCPTVSESAVRSRLDEPAVAPGEVPPIVALASGICFGLAFECRYQIAFAVMGVCGWLCCFSGENRGRKIRTLALLSCGVFLAIAAGTATDCWGYSHFVIAPWNYFRTNILLGIANRFGTSPAWWYLVGVNSGPMVATTLLWTVAMIATWWRYPGHILSWATFAFFLAHSVVAHKEVRFLFPIAQVGAMAIVVGLAPEPRLGGRRYAQGLAWLWRRRRSRWATALYASNVVALAAMGFSTRQPSVLLQKIIYDHYSKNCYAYILGKSSKSLYSNVGVDMFFYRPPGFQLKRLDGYDELAALMRVGPRKFLLITDRVRKTPEQDLIVPQAEPVYRSYPQWVENYNYFNWLQRSRHYTLYEVDSGARDQGPADRDDRMKLTLVP